jgi:hypothetical protein
MKRLIIGILILLMFAVSIEAMEYEHNTVLVNVVVGAGTFSAGEYDGGSLLDNESSSGGIVCGINIGTGYKLTQSINVYTELGYNYYGLARNSNYPEYPLGYGSGKVYASIGVSLKIFKGEL